MRPPGDPVHAHVEVSLLVRAGMRLGALDRFVRLHFVGFTSMWALLGAFSSDAGVGAPRVLALTALGVSFHLFGGVFNDLVDLPIDRTQPLRSGDALITGSVTVTAAVWLVVIQVPVMVGIVFLLGGVNALGWLGLALGAMTVYNLFGKRCKWPWVTDAAQGLAWFSLPYVGATLAAGPNAATPLIALMGFVYIMLVNGIHGGLRDLENDRLHGASTMALWLGIRPLQDGTISVPRRAWVYCFGVLGVVCAISLALVWSGGHRMEVRWLVTLAVAATDLVLLRSMVRVLRPGGEAWATVLRLHVALLLAPLLIAVLVTLPVRAAIYVLVTFGAPLLLLEVAHEVLGLHPSPIPDPTQERVPAATASATTAGAGPWSRE